MAVKYVKDFIFGPMTSVQRYAKGGHVTKVPAKAKDSAKGMPARAKPNAPAKGAKRMESPPKMGKGQGYKDGGKVPGKKMDRLPTKTPPGRDKDLAPAKPFKGPNQGYNKGGKARRYAEGGETDGDTRAARIMPGDNSPLDQYAITGTLQPVFDERGLDGSANPLMLRGLMPLEAQPYNMPPPVRYEGGPVRYEGPSATTPMYFEPEPVYESPMDRAVREAGAGRDVGLSDIMRAARAQEMGRRGFDNEITYDITGMPLYRNTPVDPSMRRVPGAPVTAAMYAKGGKVSKGQAKVGKVMGEYKRGELHSGSKKGPLVKNPKQAVAIALSEARKSGAKIAKKAEGGLSDKELGGKSFAGRNEPLRGRYVSREEKIMREAVAKEKQKDMERKMREAYERTQSQSVSGLKKGGMARNGVPTHKAKAMYGGGKC